MVFGDFSGGRELLMGTVFADPLQSVPSLNEQTCSLLLKGTVPWVLARLTWTLSVSGPCSKHRSTTVSSTSVILSDELQQRLIIEA